MKSLLNKSSDNDYIARYYFDIYKNNHKNNKEKFKENLLADQNPQDDNAKHRVHLIMGLVDRKL